MTQINAWRKHYNLQNSTDNNTKWVLISSQANGGYLEWQLYIVQNKNEVAITMRIN